MNLSDLITCKWQTYAVITDFSSDYYGGNRDLFFYHNGTLNAKAELSQEVRDTLVSNLADDTYSYLGFEFKANGTKNTAMGNAQEDQIYYIDNIRIARISYPEVVMDNVENVQPDNVVLRFSNRIKNVNSLKNNITLYQGLRKITNFTVVLSDDGYTAKIVSPFKGNTQYKLNVGKDFSDIYGKSPLSANSFIFTTAQPATFTAAITSPEQTENVPTNSTVFP